MDKVKKKIREGETSQWIREKGKSEKERHHNGKGKKENQRRRDITMDKGKRVSPSLIVLFPLSIVMSLLL
jgi:hypothetical protein